MLKKSLWVICKILGLFVNSLTTDDKYSRFHGGNLLQHFQIQWSQKRKTFSIYFFPFSKQKLNFEHFQKKIWPSELMCFWTCGLQKAWLDKSLKSPVSEDPSTSNTVNRYKNCSKLNDRIFTIFNDECARNSEWQSLFELCAEY